MGLLIWGKVEGVADAMNAYTGNTKCMLHKIVAAGSSIQVSNLLKIL